MSYPTLPLDVRRIIIAKLDPESAAIFRCVHRQSRDIIKKTEPCLLERCKNKLYIYATQNVALLDWLLTHQKIQIPVRLKFTTPLPSAAAMRKNLPALEWLWKRKAPFGSPALAVALESGDLKIVLFVANVVQAEMKKSLAEVLSPDGLSYASKGGNLDLVKWVAEISPRQASSAVAVVNAASSGNLKVLEFLHRDLRFSLPKYSIATAAGGGHIEVIEWLLEQKVSIPEQDTYREAASNGRLDVIKYLRQKHNIAFGCEPLAFAETHSHFHVVKFIMETQNLPTPSKFWLDAAAAANSVESIRYLVANKTPMEESATTAACRCGALEALQTLLELKCPINVHIAYPAALSNGHILVIRYIDENIAVQRQDPSACLRLAVKYGHISLLKYFVFERSATWDITLSSAANPRDQEMLTCIGDLRSRNLRRVIL